MIKCSKCNKENKDDNTVCEYCGNDLVKTQNGEGSNDSANWMEQAKKEIENQNKIITIGIALLGAIIFTWILVPVSIFKICLVVLFLAIALVLRKKGHILINLSLVAALLQLINVCLLFIANLM